MMANQPQGTTAPRAFFLSGRWNACSSPGAVRRLVAQSGCRESLLAGRMQTGEFDPELPLASPPWSTYRRITSAAVGLQAGRGP